MPEAPVLVWVYPVHELDHSGGLEAYIKSWLLHHGVNGELAILTKDLQQTPEANNRRRSSTCAEE